MKLHLAATFFLVCAAPAMAVLPVTSGPSGIDLIEVPAGQFTMGTGDPEQLIMELPDGNTRSIRDETPAHQVHFDESFYLSRTEITQGQWFQVMRSRPGPPSQWKEQDWARLPVTGVSWQRAIDFASALNKLDPQFLFRLPTEAEWEYAARAGNNEPRPFDAEALPNQAWYIESSGDKVQPVATRPANAWGFHDMLGNVWEWVADWYAPDYYAVSPSKNPAGPLSGVKRVRRGGSFHCPAHLVRSAYRAPDYPSKNYSVLGFRIAAERRQ